MVKRKRGDIGLRKAAQQIGITHTTLSRIESGKIPDLKTFGLLCRWLEVDPSDVLGFSGKSTTSKNTLSEPAAHYRAQKTMSMETAKHLGVLITRIHNNLVDRNQ